MLTKKLYYLLCCYFLFQVLFSQYRLQELDDYYEMGIVIPDEVIQDAKEFTDLYEQESHQ